MCEEYYNEEWDPSSFCLEKLGNKVGDLETIDQSRKELLVQLNTYQECDKPDPRFNGNEATRWSTSCTCRSSWGRA